MVEAAIAGWGAVVVVCAEMLTYGASPQGRMILSDCEPELTGKGERADAAAETALVISHHARVLQLCAAVVAFATAISAGRLGVRWLGQVGRIWGPPAEHGGGLGRVAGDVADDQPVEGPHCMPNTGLRTP